MRSLSVILLLAFISLLLFGCGPSKHRPIDVYLTVESDYGSPNPPVGENYLNYGMTITASVDSPVAGVTEGTRYVCTGWNGTGSAPAIGGTNSCQFTITQNSSITWAWKTQYELTIEILPEGSGTVELSPAGEDGYYDNGEVVTLTANSNTGYVFSHWSGDLTGAVNPQSIIMNGPKIATANFALPIPVGAFTALPRSGSAPLTVQFVDRSTGVITSSAWDFDNDGTVDSTEQHPSYRYAFPGVYTVKLTVTGPSGSDEETKIDYITVTPRIWTQRFPVASPSVRYGHAMAYDSARGVVVLFGGTSGGGETWEWDGTDWTQKSSAVSPSGRCWHAMAYDSARGVVVLYGGADKETWEWDGTNWTQRFPANSPTAWYLHAMAYDSARGVVVLFGGEDANGYCNDTWEWDGTNWSQRFPADNPSGRFGHGMAYDSARRVIVLFGGSWGGGCLNDTWEWDGTNWTHVSPASSPTARVYHATAYDSGRGVVVLFGGIYPFNFTDHYYNDTWEY